MWKEHGTKILGVVLTAIGTAATLSPEQSLALLGHRGPGIVLAASGILAVIRGLQNSGKIPGGPDRQVE